MNTEIKTAICHNHTAVTPAIVISIVSRAMGVIAKAASFKYLRNFFIYLVLKINAANERKNKLITIFNPKKIQCWA